MKNQQLHAAIELIEDGCYAEAIEELRELDRRLESLFKRITTQSNRETPMSAMLERITWATFAAMLQKVYDLPEHLEFRLRRTLSRAYVRSDFTIKLVPGFQAKFRTGEFEVVRQGLVEDVISTALAARGISIVLYNPLPWRRGLAGLAGTNYVFVAHPERLQQPASAALDTSDEILRQVWREAGGSFHGPIVETGTMPESKLLPFLRQLLATKTTAGSWEQGIARAARAASDYVQSLKSNEEATDIQTGI